MHCIFIGLGIYFRIFFVWYLLRSRTQSLNLQKHLCLHWISMVLQFRETWFLIMFMICFVTCFGIDFWWDLVSMLVPFWHQFCIKFYVFGDRFKLFFWIIYLLIFDRKWLPKLSDRNNVVPHLFDPFVRTLEPFPCVRPTSARNRFSNLFQNIRRMYPHLYLLPKQDLQMRRDRFYNLNENKNST